jgi:hypothetical protein
VSDPVFSSAQGLTGFWPDRISSRESLVMKPRRLKVSYTQPDMRGSHGPYRAPLPMPFLRLRGRWLDAAGFAIGSQVRVEVSAGRLVLEVIDPARTQG